MWAWGFVMGAGRVSLPLTCMRLMFGFGVIWLTDFPFALLINLGVLVKCPSNSCKEILNFPCSFNNLNWRWYSTVPVLMLLCGIMVHYKSRCHLSSEVAVLHLGWGREVGMSCVCIRLTTCDLVRLVKWLMTKQIYLDGWICNFVKYIGKAFWNPHGWAVLYIHKSWKITCPVLSHIS